MKSAGRHRTGTPTARRGCERQSLQPGTFAPCATANRHGHAVRFVYLMTGVAHLARLSTMTASVRTACGCGTIWPSVIIYYRRHWLTEQRRSVQQRLDLPNDTVYAESCASIGLMMLPDECWKWKATVNMPM